MRLPMPHSSVTGRGPMMIIQFAEESRNTLSVEAFANPVAILARSLVSPIPTAQVSWVWARTRLRRSCARSSGSATVAPRTASSHPQTSTG